MNYTAKLARDNALTEALRAANAAVGSETPEPQALRILTALRLLRKGVAINPATERVDYLAKVQEMARAMSSPGQAVVTTPLGALSCTTERAQWRGVRGERQAWRSSYALNGAPITIAEIRAAGLAQRPTTRNRNPKSRHSS